MNREVKLLKKILSNNPMLDYYANSTGCDECSESHITLWDKRERWWIQWDDDMHMCLYCFADLVRNVAVNKGQSEEVSDANR